MFMPVRLSFQTALRAAAVDLLRDFRDATGTKLQVYPGRPRSIHPPTAFVDRMSESLTLFGPTDQQRRPQAEIVVIHGLFDTADTAEQKDRFVDDFIEWVLSRYHAASDNTLVAVTETADDPNFVPDWLPPEEQRTYYATRITLEGTG